MTRKVRTPAEPKHGWWWGTGRRKRAVARVRLRPVKDGARGDHPRADRQRQVTRPSSSTSPKSATATTASPRSSVTDTVGKIEVVVRITGGGFMGQAQAVRLGIARALRDYDPTLEEALRDAGFLTRDAREVERKKYGQAGARRRFQFSKR